MLFLSIPQEIKKKTWHSILNHLFVDWFLLLCLVSLAKRFLNIVYKSRQLLCRPELYLRALWAPGLLNSQPVPFSFQDLIKENEYIVKCQQLDRISAQCWLSHDFCELVNKEYLRDQDQDSPLWTLRLFHSLILFSDFGIYNGIKGMVNPKLKFCNNCFSPLYILVFSLYGKRTSKLIKKTFIFYLFVYLYLASEYT